MPVIHKRTDYTIDGPDLGTPITMHELQQLADRAGSHYFERGTLRFFRSRIGATVYTRPDGWYFVTSEQFVGSSGAQPRRYSLRKATYKADGETLTFTIDTVGEFQAYESGRAAARAVPGKGDQ